MSRAAIIGSMSTRPSTVGTDIMSLMLAVALHVPLFWVIKIDSQKKEGHESRAGRLVAVDLMDPEQLLKKTAPLPVVEETPEEKSDLMSRLKALVRKEPPPVAPPKPAEEIKLNTAKAIELEPKAIPEPAVQPKLQDKAGFQTNIQTSVIEEKRLAMKSAAPLAPLSASRLGTIDPKAPAKSDKGAFQVGKAETLAGIGGGAKIADPSGQSIAIRTGGTGSKESFSAPKTDKGSLSGVGSASLSDGPKMGLRDSIIARDAAAGTINVGGTRSGGAAGGAVATKRDAGNYSAASGGGLSSAVAPSAGLKSAAPSIRAGAVVKKERPSMFVITGPLKDRKIERQVMPEYPAWAQEQGVEAVVALEFTVRPDGSVRNNVAVRRTSGYPRLDQDVVAALLKWRFAPLADINREEVGTIAFTFSLK